MNEWQPIETAPKDDRAVLLFDPDEGGEYSPNEAFDVGYYIFVGWFNSSYYALRSSLGSSGWYSCTYSAFETNPTHWMPLPEPPK